MAKPATKNDEYVLFVDEKCKEATDWKIIRQVQINRAFYSGLQWISWDRVNKRVYVPELRPGEKRFTYNKIKPAIITLLAKLTKNRVQLEVHPDTNDDDRIEVAKAGYKFLKYQWSKDDMDRKTRRLKLHMLVDGFPALKVFVDKNKGQDIPVDALSEDIVKEIGKVPKKTGEIVTLVVDQMRLKIDPSAESPEEIRWVVEETPVDVDDIYETYGVRVEKEDIHNLQMFDFADRESKKVYPNHAMVKEYWEWPCPKYPNGRKITTAGGKLLDYNENPGENPWIFFPMIPVPGRAVADGVVKDMTTPQMSYNIKRTAEARILEEMGNPMWLVPNGSILDDEELVNEIGGILPYTPVNGAEPKRVQGATVDNGWQNAMERDETDMEDISGAHEISQGATPRGNNTYGGLALQVEQDETKLAIAVHSYEEGIKKWGEKVLRLVQKYFTEEQQLSIVGENGEIEAFTFSGADLSGDEVVDVVPGSSMPTLKAVQDEKIMAMWNAGMFVDPKTGVPDVRRVVRMLGQSIASDYFDDTELDENKAKMEQRQWEQLFGDPTTAQIIMEYLKAVQEFQIQAQEMAMRGVDITQLGIQPPPPPVQLPKVRDFYDHQVHLECHNRFRKSDFYDNLPPQLQMLIDQHCAEHEQYLMAPQIAQQQAQMAQMQAQAEEAEAQHRRQMEMKQQDHANTLERELIKQQTALQTAGMRSGRG